MTCRRASAKVGVDSSEAALELARANADLNGVSDVCSFERADVAAFMRQVCQLCVVAKVNADLVGALTRL